MSNTETLKTFLRERVNNGRAVLHWYDFICPFCYIGQHRNAILARRGFVLVELPFQAHPEIPPGGISLGPRHGVMYSRLEQQAAEAGLPLLWPQRLPNTRAALAAAEWARRYQPRAFPEFQRALFQAHFALGQNLEDPAVMDSHAKAAGIDLSALHATIRSGSAMEFVKEAEEVGHAYGVQGTPAWLFGGQLLTGLRSVAEFDRLADHGLQSPK